VLAATHALAGTIEALDELDDVRAQLRNNHPRLDEAEPLAHQGAGEDTESKASS